MRNELVREMLLGCLVILALVAAFAVFGALSP